MVLKGINFLIYKIYSISRKYLLSHNCLVHKDDFDFTFWGGSI